MGLGGEESAGVDGFSGKGGGEREREREREREEIINFIHIYNAIRWSKFTIENAPVVQNKPRT